MKRDLSTLTHGRHDSTKVARRLMLARAAEDIQAMVVFLISEKPTAEQRAAARRARQNAQLIKALGI